MPASSTADPTPQSAEAATPTPAEHRDAINRDIQERWSRFSAEDISAINSVDELIQKVGSKYGQDRMNARIDVGALLKGRKL